MKFWMFEMLQLKQKKFKLKGQPRYLQKTLPVRLINSIMTKHMSFTTGQVGRLWANKPCLFY